MQQTPPQAEQLPLREYQWTGVSFLSQSDSALLADEMGLGKTVQTAVALRAAFARADLRRALIVTPAPLRLNWREEMARWAPNLHAIRVDGTPEDRQALYRLPIPVLIASYEQVRQDYRFLHETVSFDLVVLDEAQRIKNSGSEINLACRLLPRRRSWALTGTPVENRPEDLVSIFRFLRPGLLSRALDYSEMQQRIQPFFLRRRKRDVLPQLPPIIEQTVHIELSEVQRAAYDAILGPGPAELQNAPTTNILALITRLKLICNRDPASGSSAKLDVVLSVLENMSDVDDKLIIFSQFTSTLGWLATELPVPVHIIQGGMSEEERASAIAEFARGRGPRALLASLRAVGVGLNIQAASTVILFDRWWNPAVERQAMQRAHRLGRDRPLHVLKFVAVDTIEERIVTLLDEKQDLFDKLVEGAPQAELHGLTRGDLLAVLRGPAA